MQSRLAGKSQLKLRFVRWLSVFRVMAENESNRKARVHNSLKCRKWLFRDSDIFSLMMSKELNEEHRLIASPK